MCRSGLLALRTVAEAERSSWCRRASCRPTCADTDPHERKPAKHSNRADDHPDPLTVHAPGLAQQVEPLQGPHGAGDRKEHAEHEEDPAPHDNHLHAASSPGSSVRGAKTMRRDEPSAGVGPEPQKQTFTPAALASFNATDPQATAPVLHAHPEPGSRCELAEQPDAISLQKAP